MTADAFALLRPAGVTMEDAISGIEVLADRLVEKVPYNLIDNSIRHGEHVTHIKMSAEQRGEDMLIVYQGDGEGINAKDRRRLFGRASAKTRGWVYS